ncbi:MAG TPA: TonB-dependent receptor [Vitreimonas sp.]|jgi:iron complex outermembrane receptor protein|nr:TonB-dependent receptor [Vitreimonas sp.]
MHNSSRRQLLKSSIPNRLILSALAAAGSFVALSSPAFAQDATPPDQSEEIVVTGSRIHTDPLTNRQPVTQIGQEDIARTGLSATADVLQRLPISGGGLNTKTNNSGNIGSPPDGGGVGAGAAEVDLRFLGARRVLVLVDGLRWVAGTAGSGIPGSVDLNTIPSEMIDHIEVLQESASPIYGSDAIAGVVNIITRTHQDGLDVHGQYGSYYEQGDGAITDIGASYGWSGMGAHIVAGLNYQKQELISSADRPLSAFPAPYATSCAAGGCSSGAVNGRYDVLGLSLTTGNVGATPLFDPLAPHTVSATNTFRDFITPDDRFNFGPYNYIQTPSERWGGFVSWEQELNTTTTFHARLSYADRKSANQAAPLPLFLGQDAGNGTILDDTVIDGTNPYNPFGTLDASNYSFIGRRMVEAGPRHFEQEVQTWDFAATLEGQLNAFGRDWYWDANGTYGRNRASQSFTGDINVARVQQALGPIANCTGSCVPLNIFGGQGSITQDMLDFIGYTEHNSSMAELGDLSFNITGDLMQLPAGALAVAAGVERRWVSGEFNPDPITEAGLTSDIPARSGRGSYDVNELYGELRIPLLDQSPFAYMLEASVAGRVFDYSTSGSDSTIEGGLRWRPVEEVLLRASWGQGFRAPSIGELFGGGSRFDATINDPCNDFNATVGSANGGRDTPQSATIINNCIANGVPSNGSYVQKNPQLPVFVRGTTTLQPETSESWNFGAVWRPHFFDNTAFSDRVTFEVNYGNISIDSAIQAADPNTVMNICVNTGNCSAITRSASGAVRAIDDPLTNGGYVDTRFLDLTFTWQSPEWALGRFSLTSNVNHLVDFIDGSTTPHVHREGTERGSPSQGYPSWKAQTTLNWELSDWGASITERHISELTETANGDSKIPATNYWDVQLRWTPGFVASGRVQFALGVNNVTDEDTPGCFSCDVNNMDPTLYDVPGRFGYFRVAFKQ